jgi:predicted ABC-type ATPase
VSRGSDRKPTLIVIAGPNGAGKSTFYLSHIAELGLPFVNADLIAASLEMDAMRAAEVARIQRQELLARRESFCFETVFSDPVGGKVAFIERAVNAGYEVILFFIGIPGALVSEHRVAQRVAEGGHDVPTDRLRARFPRILENLGGSIRRLPRVVALDNSDLLHPYRLVAVFESGRCVELHKPIPAWLKTAAGRLLQRAALL